MWLLSVFNMFQSNPDRGNTDQPGKVQSPRRSQRQWTNMRQVYCIYALNTRLQAVIMRGPKQGWWRWGGGVCCQWGEDWWWLMLVLNSDWTLNNKQRWTQVSCRHQEVNVVTIELEHVDSLSLTNVNSTLHCTNKITLKMALNPLWNHLPVSLNTTVELEQEGETAWMKASVERLEQRVSIMEEVIKQLKGGEKKNVQQQVQPGTLRIRNIPHPPRSPKNKLLQSTWNYSSRIHLFI